MISIHAPREGGDSRTAEAEEHRSNFNPRPPRGGRLVEPPAPRDRMLCRFQSTPPARGATDDDLTISVICTISIHAPREGGDIAEVSLFRFFPRISIHAPREGGDVEGRRGSDEVVRFQSTPPARGATRCRL